MDKEPGRFSELIETMKKLRSPDGCPWDRKQDYESLRPHIIEEAYELVDAIERRETERNMKHVLEECGDLLLQVIFIGTIAEEKGDFSIDDIPRVITEKLIRRHPHIFDQLGRNKTSGAPGGPDTGRFRFDGSAAPSARFDEGLQDSRESRRRRIRLASRRTDAGCGEDQGRARRSLRSSRRG